MWIEVHEWVTWQQAQDLSVRTIVARIETVMRLGRFAGESPREVEPATIIAFLAALGDVSRNTRATYYRHLRAWFHWLAQTDRRVDDPLVHVPAVKVPRCYPRPVSDREFAAILAVPMRARSRTMIELAALQGLRVHEIAKLRGEDINVHDGQLHVLGKGRFDCYLPLHPMIAAAAADYPRAGYWFVTHVGNARSTDGPILPGSVGQIIRNVFRRAGVSGGAHRLRHWYGTKLLEQGANIRVVQQLMRHSSLQSTQIYTEVSVPQQRAAVESLGLPVGQRDVSIDRVMPAA